MVIIFGDFSNNLCLIQDQPEKESALSIPQTRKRNAIDHCLGFAYCLRRVLPLLAVHRIILIKQSTIRNKIAIQISRGR